MRILLSILLLFGSLNANSQGVWASKTSLPSSTRQSSFSFDLGGFGYLGTGNYAPGPVYLSDLWKYDPVADSWVQKAAFPISVTRAVAVTINGVAYAGTGFSGTGNVNSWYAYDPVADQWTAKANFPGTARQDAFAVALNGKAYVGGGVFSTNPNVFQDLWEYNPVSNTWTQKGNLPSSRAFAAEFVINNKAYLVGGTVAPGSNTNEVHEYDPLTDTWTAKAPFPVAANELVGFELNGKGCVGMGSISGTLQTMWYEYDPINDQWQAVTAFPGSGRVQTTAFRIGNTGYVAAGRGPNSLYLNDLWQFTPAGTTGHAEILANELTVHPNPATDRISIRSRQLINMVRLFDLQGRLLAQQSNITRSDFSMDLAGFANGIYNLEVQTENATENLRVVIR